MADSFNPYREWLGLAHGQRPATYYGLFGLKPLENDAERIRDAIVRLMTKISAMGPGDHKREWQQILNEISAAKTCLTDPAAKAAYDAQLRAALAKRKRPATGEPGVRRPKSGETGQPSGRRAQQQTPSSGEEPEFGTQPPASDGEQPPIPPPVVRPPLSPADNETAPPDVEEDDCGQAETDQEYQDFAAPSVDAPPVVAQAGSPRRGSRQLASRRGRRRTSSKLVLALGLLVIVGVIAGPLGIVVYQEYRKSIDSARLQAEAAKKAEKAPAPKAEVDADRLKPAADSQATREDPAVLQKSLAEVVAALGKRDISGARNAVSNASASARTPEDQKTVEKYKKLCDDVEQFWRIVWERVNKFKPKEEVTLGKTRIVVVEGAEGQVSFKVGSKIRVCTAETVPAWLAIALVEDKLVGDGLSKELYGAFLAVDPDGDRARAKALWSEAAATGGKIEDLLPSIDSLPPAAGP